TAAAGHRTPRARIRSSRSGRARRGRSRPSYPYGSPPRTCRTKIVYVHRLRYLHPERDEQLELSNDDVFLNPGYFDGGSRLSSNLPPPDFPGGSHPIFAANMSAVTGKRMAETMARFGGLGVLPQDMELETVERIVKHIHAADARYDT